MHNHRINTVLLRRALVWMALLLSAGILTACQKSTSDVSPSTETNTAVKSIGSTEEFKQVMASSHEKLAVIDFYADWCGPCRELAPLLEKIARQMGPQAQFYKVNIDEQRMLAMNHGVTGIPYVTFFKKGKKVHSLMGVWPQESYIRTVKQFAFQTKAEDLKETPDGEIIDGVRVIFRKPESTIDDIYVYRGETVKIIFKDLKRTYSVAIPQYQISQQGDQHNDLIIQFKADKIGVFPIFCNGDCPTGDGMEYGRVMVIPFTGDEKAHYQEMEAKEAQHFINSNEVLILDVRTPNEFYDGHLPNAKLIPVQQLSQRISELNAHKSKKILIYCRSGNRSTVASEILLQNKFQKVYHLKDGIIGWSKQGLPLLK